MQSQLEKFPLGAETQQERADTQQERIDLAARVLAESVRVCRPQQGRCGIDLIASRTIGLATGLPPSNPTRTSRLTGRAAS